MKRWSQRDHFPLADFEEYVSIMLDFSLKAWGYDSNFGSKMSLSDESLTCQNSMCIFLSPVRASTVISLQGQVSRANPPNEKGSCSSTAGRVLQSGCPLLISALLTLKELGFPCSGPAFEQSLAVAKNRVCE